MLALICPGVGLTRIALRDTLLYVRPEAGVALRFTLLLRCCPSRSARLAKGACTRGGLAASSPKALTLDDGDIAVDGNLPQPLHLAAGLRPTHFEPIDPGVETKAKNLAWIVRGEIAATAHLHPGALHTARLPGNNGADPVRVRFLAHQPHPQPMIPATGVVAQKERRAAVYGDQDVHGAIVVEITNGHAAGC